MLVVASLPIIDWNDCLLRDFQNVSKGARRHMYAAITFQRPIFPTTWSICPTRVLQNTGRNWRTCFARQDFVAIRTNSITYGARHGIALALSSIWQPETKSSSKRPPAMA